MCLAVNLFFEARGEPPLAYLWVLHVTNNRVNSSDYPESFCKVITQRGAFSWTYTYDLPEDVQNWDKIVKDNFGTDEIEMDKWEKLYTLASLFYFNRDSMEDITENSICYMTLDRYEQLDFQTHCPTTSFNRLVGSQVFFNTKS